MYINPDKESEYDNAMQHACKVLNLKLLKSFDRFVIDGQYYIPLHSYYEYASKFPVFTTTEAVSYINYHTSID